jgi:uncharacterized protein
LAVWQEPSRQFAQTNFKAGSQKQLRLIWLKVIEASWLHFVRHDKEAPMSHVPHELHEEFPEAAEALRILKANDAHFARLADEYHTLNREVHRIETNVEPASDEVLETLKKKRLHLKDQIAVLLAAAANTAS